MHAAGGVEPAAQLAELSLQDGDGDAGRALDAGEHLALRQGLQPLGDDAAEKRAERGEVGRVRQRLGFGEQLVDRTDDVGCGPGGDILVAGATDARRSSE